MDTGRRSGEGRSMDARRAGGPNGRAVRRPAHGLLAASISSAPADRRELMATYFPNVRLFDGRAVRERAGVLVDDGVIEWVGAHARAPRAARAAEALPTGACTLTPGLIDCHVH